MEKEEGLGKYAGRKNVNKGLFDSSGEDSVLEDTSKKTEENTKRKYAEQTQKTKGLFDSSGEISSSEDCFSLVKDRKKKHESLDMCAHHENTTAISLDCSGKSSKENRSKAANTFGTNDLFSPCPSISKNEFNSNSQSEDSENLVAHDEPANMEVNNLTNVDVLTSSDNVLASLSNDSPCKDLTNISFPASSLSHSTPLLRRSLRHSKRPTGFDLLRNKVIHSAKNSQLACGKVLGPR